MVVIAEAVEALLEASEAAQVSVEVIVVVEASAEVATEVDSAVAPHAADFEVSFLKIKINDDLF